MGGVALQGLGSGARLLTQGYRAGAAGGSSLALATGSAAGEETAGSGGAG